jgi:hypothetical protein
VGEVASDIFREFEVKHAVKYTRAKGYHHEKENQGFLGIDIGYRFKKTKEL